MLPFVLPTLRLSFAAYLRVAPQAEDEEAWEQASGRAASGASGSNGEAPSSDAAKLAPYELSVLAVRMGQTLILQAALALLTAEGPPAAASPSPGGGESCGQHNHGHSHA